jgi:SpoVK/Ycf46/Vps4 family AAA+-type ATPase
LALLKINLKDVVHTADCDLEKIAELTEGYSGADITNVCRYMYVFVIHLLYMCRRSEGGI